MAFSFNPPFKTPVLAEGFFTKAWELFFRDLVSRQEIIVDPFQTDGSLATFTLSAAPLNPKHVMAFVNGTYIPKYKWDAVTAAWIANYSVSKNTITFTTAPASGWLEVTTYGR